MTGSARLSLALWAATMLAGSPAAAQVTESPEGALCRLVDAAAKSQNLPADFLTRLLWQESSFRPNVVSPAGAQGVAQFMPGTARARGLQDPFDPEQAIPAGAAFLAELARQFGNRGLGAAAYNAGPTRVANWLAGRGGLPDETRNYVLRITGRTAEDWADARKSPPLEAGKPGPEPEPACLQVTAELRRAGTRLAAFVEGAFAPWGVQLAGNFSKAVALRSFERGRAAYASVLGDVRPMIIGTRLRHRGTRTFYRVRVPAASREAANGICTRLRSAGGACAVLKS